MSCGCTGIAGLTPTEATAFALTLGKMSNEELLNLRALTIRQQDWDRTNVIEMELKARGVEWKNPFWKSPTFFYMAGLLALGVVWARNRQKREY